MSNLYEFSNEREFDLLPEGDYEVVLENAEIKETKAGKPYISCCYRVREDVEQGCQGRPIFESIFPDKTNPELFDKRKLHAILLVQGKEGRYKFEDNDEIIQHINGLLMLVHVENNPADDYHDKPYNQIKYCSYKPTKHPYKTLEGGQSNKTPSVNPADIKDEDLPF
jgi:hypothetical protein